MSKKTKLWLIAATALVLAGGILFGGAMTAMNWDFSKLSTNKYVTHEQQLSSPCKNISIFADTANIVFTPSEAGTVTCYEQEKATHTVTLEGDTLVIRVTDTRKWYEYLGISFGSPKITLAIPQGQYGALSIKSSTSNVEIPRDFQFETMEITQSTGHVTSFASVSESLQITTSTGAIHLENLSTGSAELAVSTGKVTLSGITCQEDLQLRVSTGKASITDTRCKNLVSRGSAGSIYLKNVIAGERFSLERSTGDIAFDRCDAGELFVKTDTGDVTGTLLTNKVFIPRTDTGRIHVPKTATGGRCEITTDTGNIKLSIG